MRLAAEHFAEGYLVMLPFAVSHQMYCADSRDGAAPAAGAAAGAAPGSAGRRESASCNPSERGSGRDLHA